MENNGNLTLANMMFGDENGQTPGFAREGASVCKEVVHPLLQKTVLPERWGFLGTTFVDGCQEATEAWSGKVLNWHSPVRSISVCIDENTKNPVEMVPANQDSMLGILADTGLNEINPRFHGFIDPYSNACAFLLPRIRIDNRWIPTISLAVLKLGRNKNNGHTPYVRSLSVQQHLFSPDAYMIRTPALMMLIRGEYERKKDGPFHRKRTTYGYDDLGLMLDDRGFTMAIPKRWDTYNRTIGISLGDFYRIIETCAGLTQIFPIGDDGN